MTRTPVARGRRTCKKHFPVQRGLLARTVAQVKAVDGVSFAIGPGETLCLVGESGCGKSTVGKLRPAPDRADRRARSGSTARTSRALGRDEMRPYRRRMQMVFQDPYASLNPRLHGRAASSASRWRTTPTCERREREEARRGAVRERRPARRRDASAIRSSSPAASASASASRARWRSTPRVIVADEPVSALDVSVQAQVLNLLMDLQEELGLAYLFISHDLGVVEHIGHRVAVMYLGRIVEIADKDALFAEPLHPYTQALMAAAPMPDPRAKRERIVLEGDVPSPMKPPSGCRFHTRCPFAFDRCRVEEPALKPSSADGRLVACHLRD